MSLGGLGIFERNLKKVMETETFKKADLGGRGEIGYRLLNSGFGIGLAGSVDELPSHNKTNE